MHRYRTHTCGALRATDAGKAARLSGWIHRKRDHGGILFVDLRDHYGVTQVVFTPDKPFYTEASTLPLESVVTATGVVVARDAAHINPRLATGAVEVHAGDLTVRSRAETLPFPVGEERKIPEMLRLTYRFLDIRRPSIHERMALRSRVTESIRRRMSDMGFLEIQTPHLTSSSPEGARDFLIPSRLYPGKFYALPQAPQQFKQLLMIGGFDRYFQIAACFRDEDPRADRSPGEFTQLDIEMAFVEQEDVFDAVERLLYPLFCAFSSHTATAPPFPRMTYAEAMRRYGTDKPDLRFSGMVRAFQCGVPPHGGIAPGLDRILMLLTGESNIREVIPFPLTQQGQDLMMGAPGAVDPAQIDALGIRVKEAEG
jgi:aspartyl-tRNA synthetase